MWGDVVAQRRKSNRTQIKLFVDHIVGSEQRCLCVSDDVSAGGIRILGEAGPGWGKPNHVWLQFQLPDESGRSIRALSELCYERDEGDGQRVRGYRFKYISPRERIALNHFLAEREASLAA